MEDRLTRMIHTDYKMDALCLLLEPDCLSERYYPLLPYKTLLLSRMAGWRKSDAAALSDEEYLRMGLPDIETVRLLRRFFTLYDPKPNKLREIFRLSATPEERSAFRELYMLPGVKAVRASLYYRSGYTSLRDFADTTVEEVLRRTAETITADSLGCTVPLPKEVRTHMAVAKAFLWEERN